MTVFWAVVDRDNQVVRTPEERSDRLYVSVATSQQQAVRDAAVWDAEAPDRAPHYVRPLVWG